MDVSTKSDEVNAQAAETESVFGGIKWPKPRLSKNGIGWLCSSADRPARWARSAEQAFRDWSWAIGGWK